MTHTKHLFGAAALATVVLAGSPAANAVYIPPQPIGSVDKRDDAERDHIRKQQVRRNADRSITEPIFAPFYRGPNAPLNQLERAMR